MNNSSYGRIKGLLNGLCAVVAMVPGLAGPLPGGNVDGRTMPRDLYVTNDVTIPYASQPYRFRTITVLKGGRLTLAPGVIVIFDADGALVSLGELRMAGTRDSPVVLRGGDARGWSNLIIDGNDTVVVHDVHVEGVRNRVFITGKTVELHDVTFQGGSQDSNIVRVETRESSVDLKLSRITLTNTVPKAKAVLQVFGSYKSLVFEDIRIVDTGPFESFDGLSTALVVYGKYETVTALSVHFPHGCVPRKQTRVAHAYLVIMPDPASCKKERVIPIVFVPGFAASINLRQLMKPLDGSIADSGWRFLHAFNYDYFDAFAAFEAAGIPYEVAYYDWRLPADVAAREYLKPLIEKTKLKYDAETVNIVAHSFGGIVARSYIQGSAYSGDVSRLVEVGTPNQGLVRAYSAWEAGILPVDWSPLRLLVRYYAHRDKKVLRDVDAIHTYFPSVGQLMPTYAALLSGGVAKDPRKYREANAFLLSLNASLPTLLARVKVDAFAGASKPTQTYVAVEATKENGVWPDGVPALSQHPFRKDGDGTIPFVSVALPGIATVPVDAYHATLFKVSIKRIRDMLYPGYRIQHSARPDTKPVKTISILVEGQVDVSVRMPNSVVRSSVETGEDQSGEVESVPGLTWMVLPEMDGEYSLEMTSLDDTQVSIFVDTGEIAQRHLAKGESTVIKHRVSSGSFSHPSPAPSPNPIPEQPIIVPESAIPLSGISVAQSSATVLAKNERRALPPLPVFSAEHILSLASLEVKLAAPHGQMSLSELRTLALERKVPHVLSRETHVPKQSHYFPPYVVPWWALLLAITVFGLAAVWAVHCLLTAYVRQ
jgi:pimeloyl-ACP methyl ester carboxylesterase